MAEVAEELDVENEIESTPEEIGGEKGLVSKSDLGKVDSFRHTVLTMVVEELYEKAIEDIKYFATAKDKIYPGFLFRTERYMEHCAELIRAISAKRNFPGYNSLSTAKQQEIGETVRNHFDELTGVLKKIEAIELELKIDDLRSTVWVVRSLVYVVGGIFALALFLDLVGGLGGSIYTVFIDLIREFVEFLAELLGLNSV